MVHGGQMISVQILVHELVRSNTANAQISASGACETAGQHR